MNISGILLQLLSIQTGEGKSGPWKKQDIILETEGQYPKRICMSVWGEKADALQAKPGDRITAYFDIESREHNGRWFTNVNAWKIESDGKDSKSTHAPSTDKSPSPYDDKEAPTDDLPF